MRMDEKLINDFSDILIDLIKLSNNKNLLSLYIVLFHYTEYIKLTLPSELLKDLKKSQTQEEQKNFNDLIDKTTGGYLVIK